MQTEHPWVYPQERMAGLIQGKFTREMVAKMMAELRENNTESFQVD